MNGIAAGKIFVKAKLPFQDMIEQCLTLTEEVVVSKTQKEA